MRSKYIFTSLTRITDLETVPFRVKLLAKRNWSTGDYVLCEVTRSFASPRQVELTNGRMMELMKGDLLIGAIGVRHASLEATGSWKAVGREGRMHLLTAAGLIGRETSKSAFISDLIELQYLGHLMRNEVKLNMMDFVPDVKLLAFNTPVVLIVGTSMSSGKTTAAKIITRQLKKMDLKVIGAKLSGAGRYRDMLSVKDCGADMIYDFVDVGLPSTICPRSQYKQAIQKLLSLIARERADAVVIEIGASPLEPYNGDLAIKAIKKNVICTVLCASDPYAVLGVMQSFDLKPAIVSGPAR